MTAIAIATVLWGLACAGMVVVRDVTTDPHLYAGADAWASGFARLTLCGAAILGALWFITWWQW